MVEQPARQTLSDSARAVLGAIRPGREVTRPELGREVAFSKPTVSGAINELETAGLVANTGSIQGSMGRAASLYRLSRTAGWTIGLDLGGSRFELLARRLDGSLLRRQAHNDSDGADLRSLAAAAIRESIADFADNGPLRAVGIAIPRIVPSTDLEKLADPWRPDKRMADLVATLGLPQGVPVLTENNVNCAALAEHDQGAARGVANFVFLQVGLRLGMGLIVNGRLIRGATGAAGEISRLPFPFAPGSQHRSDELERYVGSQSLLLRVRAAWPTGDAPTTVPEIFERAAQSDPTAVQMVATHARDIANIALSVAAVVDPALIVLGGGVGQNFLMAPAVAKVFQEYNMDVQVTSSQLGERATVEGAITTATDHAMSELIGIHYRPRTQNDGALAQRS